ncbi:hypothetical protein Tco_0774779 [Tanacetum coccineum]|uniref:Uncharacterized protein n=1 Tax=Tanacetum coccineum TaxID=301880 RepID=A0ABQ4ZPF7_9ASTR
MERVQLLIQGTSLTKQERECKLYDAFDKFAHIKRESLHQYYLRFTQLINDMSFSKMNIEQFQVNTMFLKQSSHLNGVSLWLRVKMSPQYWFIHQPQHYSTAYPSTPLAMTYLSAPLAVHVFKQGDDPIDAINKMMSFLSTIVTSRFSSTNNQLRSSSNSRQQATIHDGRCSKPKRKRDATWFRDKVLLVEAQGSGKVLNEEELAFLADLRVTEGPVTHTVITHNAAYQADDLDAYDSDCDEISTAKAVLIANLSSYGSDVLSEVPHSENTHNDMLNQSVQEMSYFEQTHLVNYLENEITSDSNIIPYSQYLLETQNVVVQDTNSSVQQDAMILSMFEQLSNQVTNCNKVNKDNLIANESLSAELERYKERVKLLEEKQNVDLRKGIVTQTFNVLKNKSKEKEAKNINKEIALEKKVKELENIIYKLGQSAQTVNMLTKPQVFYDNNLKKALGFQNPFYLKKAQQIRPMLYDGTVIAKEINVISIVDSE